MGVNVTNNMVQQHSVWLGGSTFATMVFLLLNQSPISQKSFTQEKNI